MQTRYVVTSFFELVKTLAFIFLIAFIIRSFIIQSFRVEGSSMEPNFHDGEFLLVEKLSYRFTSPRRGEVIVLRAPDQLRIDFIKRIIGLPGETVEIENDRVKISGTAISEPYLRSGEITEINNDPSERFIQTLGADEYFVLGDNRQSSKDSRSIGTIARRAMIGKVFLVVWPLPEFGFVNAGTVSR